MVGEELKQEIRSLVAEIIELDEGEIADEANFVEDLGVDSMMALEILAAIEKKYKIQIPEEKLMKVTNLRQTVDLANEFLNK